MLFKLDGHRVKNGRIVASTSPRFIIHRNIRPLVETALTDTRIVLIVGPRQAGRIRLPGEFVEHVPAGQRCGRGADSHVGRTTEDAGLAALRDLGIRTVMLTGDNRKTAEAIAADLGVEVRAELLPQDKQRIVGEMQNEGLRVPKVGDGINDAPALAAADIGIAMGGTDVALETADAAILHGRVEDVSRMVRLSRAVMANIKQNIAVALGLKAVFLVTTVIGATGLWPAILADTGATVLVTANAMRLLG